VLEARRTTWRLGDPPSHVLWKLRLRVQPAAEPEFDVTVGDWLRTSVVPSQGTRLQVFYDPENHNRAMVDHRSDADRAAGIERLGADRGSKIFSETIGLAARVFLRGFRPGATRTALSQVDDAIAARLAGTDVSPTVQVVALGPDGQPVSEGSTEPAPSDPVEQLRGLAELNERGALTDAQFEAHKRRILDAL